MDIRKIKVGDKIKVSTWHRGGMVKGWRTVTGRLFGQVTIRCNGWGNFMLKNSEILEHETK